MSRIQSLIERINQASSSLFDARGHIRIYIDSIIGSTPSDLSNRTAHDTPTTLNEAIDQLDEEVRQLHRENDRLSEEAPSTASQLGTRTRL